MNIEALVFSGGGVRGFLQLGSLNYIENNRLEILKSIKLYSGCSIGSVIAYLTILGFKSKEILSVWSKFDLSQFSTQESIGSILKTYGLYNQDIAVPILTDLSMAKLGLVPTLKQLKQMTGKTLMCSVYNFTDSEIETLCPETHPDLSCIDAVLMSSCVPLLFPPYSYEGKEYIDAGIIDNLPLARIDPDTSILCLDTSSPVKEWKVNNILDYIYKLLNLGRVYYHRPIMNSIKILSLKDTSEVRIQLSRTERANLFISGYEQTKRWFEEI